MKHKLNHCLLDVYKLILQYPVLRTGAFSSSLEEWAEAAMFIDFVKDGTISTKASMGGLVNSFEYIGALSDFTGEIGRLAVAKASQREFEAVERIMEADAIVASGIMQCNIGGRFNKKVDAVVTNCKKVQDIIYELSLQKRGGKSLKRDPEPKRDVQEVNAADDS